MYVRTYVHSYSLQYIRIYVHLDILAWKHFNYMTSTNALLHDVSKASASTHVLINEHLCKVEMRFTYIEKLRSLYYG